MIEICNATKLYGPKVAVQDLSLYVPAGELFAFLVPTATARPPPSRCCAGSCSRPRAASASAATTSAPTATLPAHSLAMSRTCHILYEKLTGREFLKFTADLYAMPAEKARQKIDEVIDIFHLEEFVDDLTERYSHGMRTHGVRGGARPRPETLDRRRADGGARPRKYPRTQDAPAPTGPTAA